jgi:prevent-host-death family protein
MSRSTRAAPVLHVDEDIVPIAEFKAHLSEMVRELTARRRPMVITQNGRPAAVVMSPAEFDRLSYHARFVTSVEEGLRDAEAGRVVSGAALGKLLDRRYGPLPAAKAVRKTKAKTTTR